MLLFYGGCMKTVIEPEQFIRTLKRMTHEIIERSKNLNNVVLVGIEKKGTPFAKKIRELILQFEGVEVPLEVININAYRDDEKKTDCVELNFQNDIAGKVIVLVDDVLFTGRSVRAAMDAIMDIGRPAQIELAVFIDRGHRELPIRADFVGKNLPTSKQELVICDFNEQCVSIV